MLKQNKFNLDQIAFWLLCAIMFDCTALGGGTIIELFGIDIRMIMFVLFFLVSLPAVLRDFKGLLANGYFVCLFLWGVWTVIASIRGLAVGNDFGRILSAWIGFASFVLLPGTICIVKKKRQVRILLNVLSVASFCVALQTLAVLWSYNFMELETFMDVNLYMIREELGGCTGVNDAVVRIFFRSHPLVVAGCAASLGLAMTSENKKIQLLHCANVAFCLLSLLISFTRSVYLCVFACAAVAVVALWLCCDKAGRRKLVGTVGKAVGLFLALLLVCDIFFGGAFLSYGVYRTVGVDVLNKVEVALGMKDGSLGGGFDLVLPEDDEAESTESTVPTEIMETMDSTEESVTEESVDSTEPTRGPVKKPVTNEQGEYDPTVNVNAWSDNIRQQTVVELYQRIKEHPIVGSGMGSTLAVRAGLDGNNEYFYLDMTFKTGVIGTALYVAPMILMVLFLLTGYRKMDQESLLLCSVWLAGLMGIVAFSALNPYLNGSNGIALYCCSIAVFSALNKKQQISYKNK